MRFLLIVLLLVAFTAAFTCDNGRVIRDSAVNDDYCDCQDGSDEPLTNACENGSFICKNLGAKPVTLPSSRVGDGICDCCDGSDEPAAIGCSNTCEEEVLKYLKEYRDAVDTIQTGLGHRANILANSQSAHTRWETRKQALLSGLSEKRGMLQVLLVESNDAETVWLAEKQKLDGTTGASESTSMSSVGNGDATGESAAPATPAEAEDAALFPYPAEYAPPPQNVPETSTAPTSVGSVDDSQLTTKSPFEAGQCVVCSNLTCSHAPQRPNGPSKLGWPCIERSSKTKRNWSS